jgi:glycosyltransferase involved in cell wall biosynthesis
VKSLRILAVSMSARPHGIGGLEDHLHTLTEELSRRGHEVSVITARHPDGIKSETIDGVEWIYVDSDPHWLAPRWDPELERAVRALLGTRTFDVLHSQSSSALSLVRRPVPGQPPIVLSLHGNYLSIVGASIRSGLAARSPRGAARAAQSIVHLSSLHFRDGNWRAFRDCEASVPSQVQIRPSAWSHLLRPSHVHVVRSGVDARLFSPRDQDAARRELGLEVGLPVALCAGRLDRGKGPDVAIEALAQLSGDAHLVLAGDGPWLGELRALAARLGVADRVIFAGRISAELVATHLCACDVFVFPTRLAEAGPLVVAQAMATATPIVASRIGAVPEMVLRQDGDAGLLVRPGRADELAAAIGRLFADPELRERLGANGRAAVLDGMTVESMADAMLRVYEAALGGGGASANGAG